MNKPVILCVDDENIVLTSLKAQLKQNFGSNYTIETADSGEEALSIVEDLIEKEIDLPVVVADHIMPGIKGDKLLAKIYEISPKTMNIMLTGQADVTAVGNAVNNAKLYRYISKPWDITDMNMTLTEAIRSFFLDKKIEEQNKKLEDLVNQLKEYNETLEKKVKERTEEIEKQKDIVEKAHGHIQESINYAKRIQQAILPPEDYVNELFSENFIFNLPKDIVSGDFYWIKQINEYLIFIVADCTGHGVPGAFMSMLGISFLNEIIQRREITQANQVLNEMRNQVKSSLRQTGKLGEAKDGMDISVCVINSKTNIMQFSGAFNPIYIIRENTIHEIKGDRMPVGVHLNERKSFTNHEYQLEENDLIYLFTDGYIDQFGGSAEKKYLTKNFKEFIIKISELTLYNQRENLLKEFNRWKGDYDQTDDVLIMGVRI